MQVFFEEISLPADICRFRAKRQGIVRISPSICEKMQEFMIDIFPEQNIINECILDLAV
jgi:hypothetical protein